MVRTDGQTDGLIMAAGGPVVALGTCFLLLHPGITNQEHPNTALELEHMHKIFVIAYIRLVEHQVGHEVSLVL